MREFIVSEDFHPEVRGYVELVRCKDCQKNGSFDCPLFTDAVEMEMDEDFFCADAERKDGDGEHIEPVCVNCKHDYHDANGLKPNQCWTCCNGWNGERFTENHFEPKEVR